MMRSAVAAMMLFALPASAENVPPAAEETPEAASLELVVSEAEQMEDRAGLLVSATAHNPGTSDLLLLLSEAHVVPPDGMEASCAPDSPRFPTTPVLQITRAEPPGTKVCDGSRRVPKADWALSVMRLPAGGTATLVVQVDEPLRWDGELYAHLGVSYTTADRAEPKELRRAEKIGMGMMIAGLEPGGRVVPPGEGGPAVKRAVTLFDQRAVAAPVKIAGR